MDFKPRTSVDKATIHSGNLAPTLGLISSGIKERGGKGKGKREEKREWEMERDVHIEKQKCANRQTPSDE